jgi:hypothetical protein
MLNFGIVVFSTELVHNIVCQESVILWQHDLLRLDIVIRHI